MSSLWMACNDSSIKNVSNLFSLPNVGSFFTIIQNLKSGLSQEKKTVFTDGIFETDAYGVPSKSQNPTVLG